MVAAGDRVWALVKIHYLFYKKGTIYFVSKYVRPITELRTEGRKEGRKEIRKEGRKQEIPRLEEIQIYQPHKLFQSEKYLL